MLNFVSVLRILRTWSYVWRYRCTRLSVTVMLTQMLTVFLWRSYLGRPRELQSAALDIMWISGALLSWFRMVQHKILFSYDAIAWIGSLTTWDVRLYFLSEIRCAADFIALKYPSSWPGSNLQPLSPMLITLTTTPPRRLIELKCMCVNIIWFRTERERETVGGLWFHKRRGIYWTGERLLASKKNSFHGVN
jgi:hypothetical protein